MSIKRTRLPFERDFVQIPNAWMRDKRLSRRARGLLAELMTHREGYRVSVRQLVASGIEGRDAVRHMINELANFGYLRQTQTRSAGKFGEWEFEVVDPATAPATEPTGDAFSGPGEPPAPENPAPGKPAPVNPPPKNTSPSENTRGGEKDATPSPPTPASEPYPWCCARHPQGFDGACTACEIARKNWRGKEWTPVTEPKARKYDPAIYCEHLQIIGKCDMCDQEARRAAAILERQFGVGDD